MMLWPGTRSGCYPRPCRWCGQWAFHPPKSFNPVWAIRCFCRGSTNVLRIRPSMRRLLLIFLLVFMPLQSIWAAASPYCGHEAAPQASHFGHHVHDHVADESPAHPAKTSTATPPDMDCHACHGAGSGLAHSLGDHAIVVTAARPPAQAAPAWPPAPLSRPERPNWPVLA